MWAKSLPRKFKSQATSSSAFAGKTHNNHNSQSSALAFSALKKSRRWRAAAQEKMLTERRSTLQFSFAILSTTAAIFSLALRPADSELFTIQSVAFPESAPQNLQKQSPTHLQKPWSVRTPQS